MDFFEMVKGWLNLDDEKDQEKLTVLNKVYEDQAGQIMAKVRNGKLGYNAAQEEINKLPPAFRIQINDKTVTGKDSTTPSAQPIKSGEKLTPEQSTQLVISALDKEGILNPETLAYALATIKHETAGSFMPVREGFYNDEKYGYEPGFTGKSEARKNKYSGGENYYGRGYIQLTHDYNYKKYGDRLGRPDLGANPDAALDPELSSSVLAAYFKDRGTADLASKRDFLGARGTINADNSGQMIANEATNYLKETPSLLESYRKGRGL